MDVIGFLVGAILLVAIAVPIIQLGLVALATALALLPVVIGLLLGGWLWFHGHDNVGVIVFLLSLVVEFFWWGFIEKTMERNSTSES